MLDPDNRISIQEEEDVEAEVVKRAVIMKNAMQAAVTLSRQQPDGDYTVLREVLDAVVQLSPTELRQARIDPLMQAEAKRTLEFLNRADR